MDGVRQNEVNSEDHEEVKIINNSNRLPNGGKIIVLLAVLSVVVLSLGCAEDKEITPEAEPASSSVSAEGFADVYVDLERIDRKYTKVLDSFLKRNDIEGDEYRLTADSTFLAANPAMVKEYKKLTARYSNEKIEVFVRGGFTLVEYEAMLKILSSGENSAWADSVVLSVKRIQQP